jgi:hypothetical protein
MQRQTRHSLDNILQAQSNTQGAGALCIMHEKGRRRVKIRQTGVALKEKQCNLWSRKQQIDNFVVSKGKTSMITNAP